jgi:transcriptional regulator with XRE-family HTH domain
MSEALGDKLREAREARGMTIEQLAAVTKLNPQFIEALEKGRWDLLPGQVYLRPFVKSCAEALNLNLKELYRLIDGQEKEKTPAPESRPEAPARGSRFDYRIPVVIVTGLVVIGLIYFTVRSRHNGTPSTHVSEVVPAESVLPRREAKWDRPWERPAQWETGEDKHRLRLEASDTVWACILVDGDTTFDGILNPGKGLTFTSKDEFIVSLGRNDCVSGYFDGNKIPGVGSGKAGPHNLRLGGKNERSEFEH